MNHWLGSTNKVIMARDSLTGLLVEVEGTMVAHLFRLMAGMMVIVVVSVLMRVGDLLMRALVGAPFGATVGWTPSVP
jgi:hypothetical protein